MGNGVNDAGMSAPTSYNLVEGFGLFRVGLKAAIDITEVFIA
jgi:hypothetical protein